MKPTLLSRFTLTYNLSQSLGLGIHIEWFATVDNSLKYHWYDGRIKIFLARCVVNFTFPLTGAKQ